MLFFSFLLSSFFIRIFPLIMLLICSWAWRVFYFKFSLSFIKLIWDTGRGFNLIHSWTWLTFLLNSTSNYRMKCVPLFWTDLCSCWTWSHYFILSFISTWTWTQCTYLGRAFLCESKCFIIEARFCVIETWTWNICGLFLNNISSWTWTNLSLMRSTFYNFIFCFISSGSWTNSIKLRVFRLFPKGISLLIELGFVVIDTWSWHWAYFFINKFLSFTCTNLCLQWVTILYNFISSIICSWSWTDSTYLRS